MIETINGKTRTCGLIGNPVEHTLSPVIHNYLASACGHNLVYVPFHVEQDVFGAVRGGFALNILGMNVTVPYKKEVMQYLVQVDENAERIGAVNTLVRIEDGYKGYNTDYLGLKRTLEMENIRLGHETVVLLGAGGAANAAAYLCAQCGAKELYILNRTAKRAQQLADHVQSYFPDTAVQALKMEEYNELPDRQLVVLQATSVGLHPHIDEAVIEDAAFYKKVKQGVDIIYNPEETKFMKLVRAQGGRAVNGLQMLLYQAVTAYELWNGVTIDEEICQRVLKLLQKEFSHE